MNNNKITLREGQQRALLRLLEFISNSQKRIFILKGYAGTGKTTLIRSLISELKKFNTPYHLVASTGRAAKIMSNITGETTDTVHGLIYNYSDFNQDIETIVKDREKSGVDNSGQLMLKFEVTKIHNQTNAAYVYIVDEASMISNEGLSGSVFGTGRLLDDLVQFVYAGQGCRLLLMGDTAQLPPVGEELSPALYADALRGYGLEVVEAELTQVVRQEQQSGVLWNATVLRRLITEESCYALPKIRLSGFADIKNVPGNELIDTLSTCYDRDGLDETIVVCRSNKRANIYNNGIRVQILWREEELETGDRLMVVKNNYYWTGKQKVLDFIANGETVVVRRVRRTRELYGFRFADVVVAFPDYDELELEVTLLLDTLHSEAPALSRDANERLFQTVLEDYADIPLKRDRMKKMKSDPHYNALQVKYAYAVTCHKAQGGQWKNVFLDQGYMSDEYLTPDYFRWLYTAFTRATGTLYLVNYPLEQVE